MKKDGKVNKPKQELIVSKKWFLISSINKIYKIAMSTGVKSVRFWPVIEDYQYEQ